MKITDMATKISRITNGFGFFIKKKSPELLVLSGVISTGAAIFFAITGTRKLEKTLEKSNADINKIKEKLLDKNKIASGEYTIKGCNKELAVAYTKSIANVVKIYLPTMLFFGASISSLFGVHKILKGRNFALAAAYTALNNTYKNYRRRVVEKVGEEVENGIFRNICSEETVDSNGNKVVEIKGLNNPNTNKNSIFSYCFDASNPDWCNSGRLNLDFLLAKEKYLNQKFIAQGYLFLSDVHEALGIEAGMVNNDIIQASRIIGWIYDTSENASGDNYISFGLSDKEGNLKKDIMDMLRHGERDVWLEFNPDGDILTGDNNKKTFMKYAKR